MNDINKMCYSDFLPCSENLHSNVDKSILYVTWTKKKSHILYMSKFCHSPEIQFIIMSKLIVEIIPSGNKYWEIGFKMFRNFQWLIRKHTVIR